MSFLDDRTVNEVEKIVGDYKAGKTLAELAKEWATSVPTITKVLDSRGVERRKRGRVAKTKVSTQESAEAARKIAEIRDAGMIFNQEADETFPGGLQGARE